MVLAWILDVVALRSAAEHQFTCSRSHAGVVRHRRGDSGQHSRGIPYLALGQMFDSVRG